jgi:hypothetical protein
MNKYNIDFFYMHLFTMQSQCVLNQSSNQDAHLVIILVQDKNTSLKLTVGVWVTGLVTVIGRLYRETDTVLKKLLILIKY